MIHKYLRILLSVLAVIILVTASPYSAQTVEKTVVEINGFKMKYLELGPRDGEPIIFLHGVTDSSHSWSSTAPLLADKYHCFVLDQRGHGDSERPQGGYTVTQLGEDVTAFMDARDISRAVLVGHSMGSFVAHQVGWVYPDRVSRLVLVASAPTCVRNATLTEVRKTIGSADFKDPIDPKFILEWQTGPNPVDPDFFAKVLQETAKPPARVWKAAFRGLLTDDHSAFLADIRAPILIIWGDKDSIFLRADQDALLKVIPGATLKVYTGAGHNVQWEVGRNQQVADDIRAFLAKP